jgi:2-polyprenyl-3-methyl-5-hydroxy-6-metoxy-1,4-benzoquinol methylase
MTSTLADLADKTERSLWETKLASRVESFWYPYRTLTNIHTLEQVCAVAGLDLLQVCRGPHGRIADIGAGDGDLAFFFEKMGFTAEIIDNEYTNFNRLQGARVLKEVMNSSVEIQSVDLDSQFALPDKKYDIVFFLGTLYHLKNPFFVLEKLARVTTRCFLSTRVAKRTSDGQNLSPYPVAYLLAPQECNNDDTNFWIFTDEGLKRIADRTGWKVVSYITVGETKYSTPADPDHDERAFCLLERKRPTLSAFPNPVPAGNELGKTTISWDTSDGSIGKVYVSKDGGEESLFTDSRRGTAVADWIQTGSNYEFRLYDSDHTELLASVIVTTTSR